MRNLYLKSQNYIFTIPSSSWCLGETTHLYNSWRWRFSQQQLIVPRLGRSSCITISYILIAFLLSCNRWCFSCITIKSQLGRGPDQQSEYCYTQPLAMQFASLCIIILVFTILLNRQLSWPRMVKYMGWRPRTTSNNIVAHPARHPQYHVCCYRCYPRCWIAR